MEEEIFDPQMREKIIERWYACSELLLYRLMVKVTRGNIINKMIKIM